MKILSVISFFFLSINLFCQGDLYSKGVIIDSIWLDKKLEESFAFYAPESYEASRPSPVIFIFDPMARGKTGIEPFILTAETYGYVLVCSNNSKNGPYDRNYAIATRLFNKITSDLNINPKLFYTAGFSGGGRFASALAANSDQIQGVVSCGAAYNMDSGNLPGTQMFSFATIMGDEDMNYYELAFTDKYLDKISLSHEIFTFEINHRWPDDEHILMAFDWMQLEAYKKLLLPLDTSVVDRIYKKFYHQAKLKEERNDLLGSVAEYRRILNGFNRYYQLDSIREKVDRISQSKNYGSQKKMNDSFLETEKNLTYDYLNRFGSDLEKKSYNPGWWNNRIEKLKKKQESKSKMEQKMYKRLLYRLYAHAIETVNYTDQIKTLEQRMFCYDLCIFIYPGNPVPYLRQIGIAMALDKSDLALDYLEKLLDSGYENRDYIMDNLPLQALRNNERFEKLMRQN